MGLISDGSTIFDAGAMSIGGSMTLIKTLTASNVTSLSFMNGTNDVVFNSNFKEYFVTVNNFHPRSDNKNFEISFSTNGSNFGLSKTTTQYRSIHTEDDGTTALAHIDSGDLVTSTANQILVEGIGNNSDQSCSGYIQFFDPAQTTFLKHFRSVFSSCNAGDRIDHFWVTGYADLTGPIVGFKFESGAGVAFDGVFSLYGIK